jgi:hypothetical protein
MDSLPTASILPDSPSHLFPAAVGGSSWHSTPSVAELLAPFALRDWCASRPAGEPAQLIEARDWIPAEQLEWVASDGGDRNGRKVATLVAVYFELMLLKARM